MKLYHRSTLFAFVAPVIVAAVGLVGSAAAIASSALSVAIGLGLSFAAQALMPKPKTGVKGGARLNLQIATDAPRDVILGEAATGGQLVYWHVYGSSNKNLQLVIALASHPIEGITEILIDGEAVTWNSGTGVVDEYPGMTIKLYDGTQVAADASLVANSGGRWTSSEIGTGVAYVVIEATYKAKTYPKGIPAFVFRVQGAALYDPRTTLTAYTDNSAVIAYNVLRGISYNGIHLIGLRAPVEGISDDDAQAAMNACDEAVSLKAGGTEARYRCGLVVNCDMTNRSIMEAVLASMGGRLIHAGGIYRIQAGVAQTSVAHISDDDLISDEELVTVPKFSRSELVNAVFGSFADPTIQHKMQPLPPRTSSSDEAEDGGIRLARTVDLAGVFSGPQGQRLMELERKRARRMLTVQGVFRARWSVLEVGDWVTFTSPRRGYVAKQFEVIKTLVRADQTVELTLRETDATIDDWTAATDELDSDAVIDLAPGRPGVVAVTPTAVTAIIVAGGGDGAERPGLRVDWTAPDDETVSEIVLEYRKQGDTVALERRISDPEAGTYTWVDGVQGGVDYEVRLRPITIPASDTVFSTWVAAGATTGSQVVATALVSEIADETVGLDQLDAEARFHAEFALRTEEMSGSIAEHIARLRDEIQILGASVLTDRIDLSETRATVKIEQMERVTLDEAFASYRVEVEAALSDKVGATAFNTLEARVNDNETDIASNATAITGVQSIINDPTSGNAALASAQTSLQSQVTTIDGEVTAQASAITTLETEVDGNSSSITQILSDVGGNKRFAVVFDNDGKLTGLISLDGTTTETELIIGVSALKVFDPTVDGGVPLPLLDVQTVDGQAEVVINGTLLAKAIEAGIINAVEGTIGKLTDPLGAFYLDFNNGKFARNDGGMTIDLKNKEMSITF